MVCKKKGTRGKCHSPAYIYICTYVGHYVVYVRNIGLLHFLLSYLTLVSYSSIPLLPSNLIQVNKNLLNEKVGGI